MGCAQGEPVVLLLDDLQWADPSTLQTLHYLGRQVGEQALLLVGAYRSTRVDPHHPLAALREQLARSGVLTEITLPAFACCRRRPAAGSPQRRAGHRRAGRTALPGDRGTPLLPGRGAAHLRAGASGRRGCPGPMARGGRGRSPPGSGHGPYLPTCARRCWAAWIAWRWTTGGCWTTPRWSAGHSRCRSWRGCSSSPSLRWPSGPTGCRSRASCSPGRRTATSSAMS